jgi:hypothetical protein
VSITRTAGAYDPLEWPVYFSASNVETLRHAEPAVTHVLVAVNEMHNERDLDGVRMLLDRGKRVLIDSGVFWLSTQHAKAHGLSMDQALSMPPEEIDNFTWLYDTYVSMMQEFGDRSWGYIEIDQGGRDNKIRTRARLEAMGLRPIPVYHPFNDGWDYFDYLAERYDRICFGNVVQADVETRKRLVATAWERRRKYPYLWIHMLGLTPSEKLASYPTPSCDSSTWLSPVRWGNHAAIVANRRCWSTGLGFLYEQSADPGAQNGHEKARRMAGYESEMLIRITRRMFEDNVEALGLDLSEWKQRL